MTAKLANAPDAALNETGTVDLAAHYRAIRRQTEDLCEPLVVEDFGLQSMPEASPVKWHLAHTAWFFETFVLAPHVPAYRPFHPRFKLLFNSYYNAVGPLRSRLERGLLSRPTVAEVYRYRAYVDQQLEHIWPLAARDSQVAATVLLGINHEQQHQELILTDLKHAWAANPLHPAYREELPVVGNRKSEVRGQASEVLTSDFRPLTSDLRSLTSDLCFLAFPERLAWIGHDGNGFAFDNETPRHRVFLHGFRLASRLVTNADYLNFIGDGGYERPEFWLSDGWAARQTHGWAAPLYWQAHEGDWSVVSLAGLALVNPEEPVCHVSYYEADAFARWAGGRLPTEAEWETAAAGVSGDGHFLESGRFHPAARLAPGDQGPCYQMFGDVWQWTASPYVGYPGYEPAAGALGEYNGKFMCNQFVLRGASCVTPRSHARRTYRNFFPPEARWQFTGVRLAKDIP
jgi:ergothioneine biosynthesis protein EgtB